MKRREAPLSADFVADQTTICAGSSVNFTDLSTSATSWSCVFEGGTPATSTDQNPTVTYDNPGDYDVELTVSNASGSETETKVEYISVLVTPEQAEKPEGDSAVCTNNSYNYTTDEVDYAQEYDWELNPANAGTLTGNGTTATLQTANDWTGDFTIKVRATNICGDGDWSDDFEGTLSESPEFYEISDGGYYCDGGDGVEITQDGSDEGVDYELFHDDVSTGVIIAGTGSEISYGFFTEEGEYTAFGTSGSCSEQMDGLAVISINYVPDPADTPTGDTAVCSGTTSDYSVAPIYGADTIYWYLSPSEAGNIIGNGENISVDWAADFEGTASLSAQGENDCGLGDESEALEISCSKTPTPVISGLDMICKEEEADYSTTENDGSTYEWTVSGGEIVTGEGTYQITVLWGAPGSGTVNLTETVGDSCEGVAETFDVTIDDCIGIEEAEKDNFNIFPNPASNLVNIQSASLMKSIKVYDFTGKEILSKNVHAATYQLNTSMLNSGIYLMVIETEKVITNKRIIIE
jgi:PKD repeat protein